MKQKPIDPNPSNNTNSTAGPYMTGSCVEPNLSLNDNSEYFRFFPTTTLQSPIPLYDLSALIDNMGRDSRLRLTHPQAVNNAIRYLRDNRGRFQFKYSAFELPDCTVIERGTGDRLTFGSASEATVRDLADCLKVGDVLETPHRATARNFFAVAQADDNLSLTVANGWAVIERVKERTA
jgi:hypothetical protein